VTTRFVVLDNAEPGWDSKESAQEWIDRQDDPSIYRILPIQADKFCHDIISDQIEFNKKYAFNEGIEAAMQSLSDMVKRDVYKDKQ